MTALPSEPVISDQSLALHLLRRRFPGTPVWFGSFTRHWWALFGDRLIEAAGTRLSFEPFHGSHAGGPSLRSAVHQIWIRLVTAPLQRFNHGRVPEEEPMGKHDKTSGDGQEKGRPIPPSQKDGDNKGGGGKRGK